MAAKKGHKRINFNIPDEDVEILKARAEASESNMAAVVNGDIAKGNNEFLNSQDD